MLDRKSLSPTPDMGERLAEAFCNRGCPPEQSGLKSRLC